MVLAIEADGTSYRQSGSVRDRDRLRGEHLQRLGWHFHRIWSTNWFRDPQAEVVKLQRAYDAAVKATAPPEPETDPETDPETALAPEPDPAEAEFRAEAGLPPQADPAGPRQLPALEPGVNVAPASRQISQTGPSWAIAPPALPPES
jgi:REase_MTES_1575